MQASQNTVSVLPCGNIGQARSEAMAVDELMKKLREQVCAQLTSLQEAERQIGTAGGVEPTIEALCDLCGDAESAVKTANELCMTLE